MASVAIACLYAAALFTADAVVTKADDAVVEVRADAKQIMRNVNMKPAAAAAPAPAKTVVINLYYETRCPDCVEFINQTLAPMWRNKELRPHLNITLNPYGNAMSVPLKSVSPGYKFWHENTTGKGFEYVHICQHGADECLGNLIQACAISLVEQSKHMEMVLCMAAVPNWSIEKSSYECMTKAKIDQKLVKECVNSPQGNRLLADLGKQTQAVPGRKGTPWVMINGANLANTTELMRTICGHVGDGASSCAMFRTKDVAKAPTAIHHAGGGDFTVLPQLQKNLVQLSPTEI